MVEAVVLGKHQPQNSSRELSPFPAHLPRGQAFLTSCEKQSGDVVWRLKYETFRNISMAYGARGPNRINQSSPRKVKKSGGQPTGAYNQKQGQVEAYPNGP